MADEEKDEGATEGGEGKSKKKLLIIIILAVVVLGGAGAGAFLFLGGEEVPEEDAVVEDAGPQPAQYFEIKPQFVINYDVAGRDRFMQVYVTVMSRDGEAIAAIDQHMPLIRNNLVLAMGALDFDSLRTPAGKEQLREAVKQEINSILKQETGQEGVESILFTNLVMQ